MGRLVEALRAANALAANSANSAKSANPLGSSTEISKFSEISSGHGLENATCASDVVTDDASEQTPPDTAAMRLRLLAVADREWIDAALIRALSEQYLADCVALNWDDRQWVPFVHGLADAAERMAGRVPKADTAAMYCQVCGPVWVHPDIAATLLVVGGWPSANNCLWSVPRKAGGFIPRPSIACAECQHFKPDILNPTAGMGGCGTGHGMHWAGERHTCASFQPGKRLTA